VSPTQRLRDAITAHLATKVDVREIAWLEQVATHSRVDRDPRGRVLATGYLALLPADLEPALPGDTAWFELGDLPRTAFDHHYFIEAASDRLRAKLSYTNIGFALAPPEFTIQRLRDIVSASLGYEVDQTNLHRVLTRREMIEPTGAKALPGRSGGRPAAVFRFRERTLVESDPFATLRPPAAGRVRNPAAVRRG
jgi:8-oxo-dGTP diphosphatase